MKIIFDLDYTLLDTKKLRDKLVSIFNKESFERDLKKYFKDRDINFNLEKYLAILKSGGRINERRKRELKLKLAELMDRLDNCLFPGVIKILNHFKGSGAELILLTFGDKEYQKEKVKHLSIGRHFDQIIFEDKNKSRSELLKSLEDCQEEVLLVNDNAGETKAMVAIIGRNAKVFLINGPYAKNIKHNWPIHELDELNKLKV